MSWWRKFVSKLRGGPHPLSPLAAHRQDAGYCCSEHTLYHVWLTLPLLFPNERKDLERKLRALEHAGRGKGR